MHFETRGKKCRFRLFFTSFVNMVSHDSLSLEPHGVQFLVWFLRSLNPNKATAGYLLRSTCHQRKWNKMAKEAKMDV